MPARHYVSLGRMPRLLMVTVAVVCPLLLIASGIGFVRALDMIRALDGGNHAPLMRTVAVTMLPLVAFALLTAYAAARYVRAKVEALFQARLEGLQQRQSYHEDLVRLIADNRPGATVIIDQEDRIWFANRQAAFRINMTPADVVGRQFEKTFPETDVLRLMPLLQKMRATGAPVEEVGRIASGQETKFVQSQLIPMPHVTGLTGAVMISEEDITNLMVEREARERMFRQVIDTLVAIVDRRDPYAAGHSARVGQVARVIAAHLRLEPTAIETAEIAGLLMNFGKVLVSPELLTKTGQLTQDELRTVRDSILTSADILALIGFSQPVVPTLRQVLERFDGTGAPNGLHGEAILLTARIVTVANAFVALVSARAHRPGLSVQAAVDVLMRDADKIYDRRVVTALSACIGGARAQLDWLPA